jgi:hypothetical protein
MNGGLLQGAEDGDPFPAEILTLFQNQASFLSLVFSGG